VIVAGYLGVALVVGVSAALLAVVAGRTSDRVKLFLRCLRWGVATGAATGAVVGAMIALVGGRSSSQLNLILGFGIYAAVIGVLVSLIPTLVGAVFITERQRYPYPSAEDDVQSDVTAVFGVVVGVINVPLFVSLFAAGNGWASIVGSLPFITAGNACVLLMHLRARRSIGRVLSATATDTRSPKVEVSRGFHGQPRI